MTTLNEALAQIITKASQGVEAGAIFLSGQLPDVIHQLLLWNLVKSGILCSIAVLLVFSHFYIFRSLYRKMKASQKYIDDDFYPVCCIIGGTIWIIATPLFLVNIFNLLQIWIAPKIWLIEYAAEIIKSK